MNFKYLRFSSLKQICPVPIGEIELTARSFYRLIHIPSGLKGSDISVLIPRILEARRNLVTCRILLHTMIEPEHNDYVAHYKDAYTRLNENLGRYDRRVMDAFDKEMSIIDSKLIGSQERFVSFIQLRDYSKHLEEAMDAFVYYPLFRATKRYYALDPEKSLRVTDGNEFEIVKDEVLFSYLVFINLLHVSDTLGIWTRDEKQKAGTSFEYPPETPANVRTTPIAEERQTITPENFQDQFMEEENVAI